MILPLNAPVCPDGPTVAGIDVSVYQGDIDWAKVRAAGVAYAFIRVANGTGTFDAKFDRNWSGARAAGVLRGAYHYFRHNEDAIAQADFFLDKLGPLEDDDLPPAIDVETTDGQPPEVVAENVRRWVARVEAATGRRPIVYTGLFFWNDSVGGSTVVASSPLWVPQYGPACPTLPRPWTRWTFFQHSATGSVPGIAGNVDLDTFNGDRAALELFIAPPAPAPDAGPPSPADAAPPAQLDDGGVAGGCALGGRPAPSSLVLLLALVALGLTSRTAGRRSAPSTTSRAARSTRAGRRRPSCANR